MRNLRRWHPSRVSLYRLPSSFLTTLLLSQRLPVRLPALCDRFLAFLPTFCRASLFVSLFLHLVEQNFCLLSCAKKNFVQRRSLSFGQKAGHTCIRSVSIFIKRKATEKRNAAESFGDTALNCASRGFAKSKRKKSNSPALNVRASVFDVGSSRSLLIHPCWSDASMRRGDHLAPPLGTRNQKMACSLARSFSIASRSHSPCANLCPSRNRPMFFLSENHLVSVSFCKSVCMNSITHSIFSTSLIRKHYVTSK